MVKSVGINKQGGDFGLSGRSGLSSFFTHIKKKYVLMVMTVFIAQGVDAQGLSLDKKEELLLSKKKEILDTLGQSLLHFYDIKGNILAMDTVDWFVVIDTLKHKPLNTLNFLEAQQLFYLYFGPGLASQEYIRRAHGHPDLLIRILTLSTVEKWGNFASFNPGVVWDENLSKYKKLPTLTNRGTFQIHASSYVAMRKKYARYLQSGLHTLGVKEISGIAIMDWPIGTVSEINLFENQVKELLGKNVLNQQQRTLADAQMDLIVHLKYLDARDLIFRNAKGRSLWKELARPDLPKNWLAQLMSYRVQGGKPIIGKTFLKREFYPVEMVLDHPRVKKSGSNFLQVLASRGNTFLLDTIGYGELVTLKDDTAKIKNKEGPSIKEEQGLVLEEKLSRGEEEIADNVGAVKVVKKIESDPGGEKDTLEEACNTPELGFEQTRKTDFVLHKLEKMLDNHEDYFVLEIQKGGLDGGPIPTFYNFAVTLVDMGFMQTKDILPLLSRIKSSCRGTSFAFLEYQYLQAGQKVPVNITDLDKILVKNRRTLAISSLKAISK